MTEYGKWIPVTERVPDHDDSVLVSCETRAGVKSVSKGFYFKQHWACSYGLLPEVKAWMELPEPYKEDKNE